MVKPTSLSFQQVRQIVDPPSANTWQLLSQGYLCTLQGARQKPACLQGLTHSMLALGAREIHGTSSFQPEVHQVAQRPPWLQGR